jgi:tRNA dimethylallyltransferase
MPLAKQKIPLIVVLGPTAVGKTDFALNLAEQMETEIVSADSRLLYRGMDIGTAKPELNELARVPHHLINVADPDETWSLVQFQIEAEKRITDIYERNKIALLVGGTGQYLRSILEGWTPPKVAQNPNLRAALEAWADDIGEEALHTRLVRLDSKAASKIDPRNLRRTLRALEVIFLTGKTFSRQREKTDPKYNSLSIGLSRPRPELYKRIDTRIETMLNSGWLQEVKDLLDKGYSPDLPSLSAIGYRQLVQHLQGEISLEEAIVLIKRDSRAFVRRQTNWFKPSDPQIHWFDLSESDPYSNIDKLIEEKFAGA